MRTLARSLWISVFLVGSGAAEESELAERMRNALFAEEGERDVAKAEREYHEILRRFDGDRAIVATAMLRLGMILDDRGGWTTAIL